MKFRTTWLLLLVVVIAAGYYLFIEQPRHKRERTSEVQTQRLTGLSDKSVSGLVIERPDVTLRFEPVGETWRMLSPVEDRADRATVNTLLRTVLDAVIERRFAVDEGELAQYGLDPPGAIVRLETGDSTLSLAVGDLNVTKVNCYARLGGEDEVLMLPAGLRRYAQRDVFEFRDKKILDFDIPDVRGLATMTDDVSVEWTRISPDEWITTEGADTILADASQIKIMLGELRAMRAQAFLEDSADNTLVFFDPPRGTATIVYGPDSTRATFVFSEKLAGFCYVKLVNGSRVARVDPDAIDFFGRSVEYLRDRRVARFVREAIARIEFDADGLSGSVIKGDKHWSFANPELGMIQGNRVMVFLYRLEGVMFKEIIEERLTNRRGYGLDLPAYRLTLFDAEGRIVDEILAGETRPEGNVRYATSRSSGHVGFVDAEPLQDLVTRFEGFKVR